jgi:hypothetical protein
MHPSLPQSLTPENLGIWISQNAKEKFTEKKIIYYTEDELQDFKNKSIEMGIEIKNLTKQKKKFNALMDKGCEEYIQVDVLETRGIKALKASRELIEECVEKGYYETDIKIYGIPNVETKNMDFFDIEGNIISERSRPLSTKEIRDYLGQYALPFPGESKQAI